MRGLPLTSNLAIAGTTAMTEFSMEWPESGHAEGDSTHFSYDLSGAFRDIDFHNIESESNWAVLKARSAKSITVVEAPKSDSLSEMQKCVQPLRKRGTFRRILFVMRLASK